MVKAPSLQLLAALRGFQSPFKCAECTRKLLRPTSNSRIHRTRLLQTDAASQPPATSQSFRKELKEQAKARKKRVSATVKLTDSHTQGWELTVGIEIHAELNTARKLFSPAFTSISDRPNTHVSVFDAALPGTQPQFQKATLLPALRAALAFDCDVARKSSWDRKHYFWWDQPNGYQITQYYEPFAKNGTLTLYEHDDIDPLDFPSVTVGIKQIQMEQDTAKTILQPPHTHLLDFNRVSHPLIEIITLPQIHSPKTAAAVVRKIQSILKAVGANVTGMEMGGLRADVNVSVRRLNEKNITNGFSYGCVSGLGQRTEIKNLSSFKAVEDAIIAERDRQIQILEAGGVIEGETRGFTLGSNETRRLRGKEGEVDYRYMPDPDLAPVIIGEDLIQHIRDTLPSLPDELLKSLTENSLYRLPIADAKALIVFDDGDRLDYYLDIIDCLQTRHNPSAKDRIGRVAGNWVIHELGALLTTYEVAFSEMHIDASTLAALIAHVLRNEITHSSAKSLLTHILTSSSPETRTVSELIDALDLRLNHLTDDEYAILAEQVASENSEMVDQIRQDEVNKPGKVRGKIMWFVGQMVRKGEKGRVQPERAEKAIRSYLGL